LWTQAYPKSKKIFFKRERYSHKEDDCPKDVFVGFLNVPIVKRISLTIRFLKELWRVSNSNENYILINYSLSSLTLLPIAILHKRFKQVCQIIPDLPEYMSSNKNNLYKIGKSIDRRVINWCLSKVNSFALLSPYMKEKLPIGDKRWMQLEGIYNPADINNDEEQLTEEKKVVMYSGALDLRYGIGDLVEAFINIDNHDRYELWLCGNGDQNVLSLINKKSEQDNRIKYLGVLERSKVLLLQRRATVLVNPRHKTEVFTKYSFPSKTMEYLASGTPVIMSHLECIPTDYDNHIFYFDDESIEGMRNKIVEICNKPKTELIAFGKSASDFIIKNKTSVVQAKRLYDFLNMK